MYRWYVWIGIFICMQIFEMPVNNNYTEIILLRWVVRDSRYSLSMIWGLPWTMHVYTRFLSIRMILLIGNKKWISIGFGRYAWKIISIISKYYCQWTIAISHAFLLSFRFFFSLYTYRSESDSCFLSIPKRVNTVTF